MTVAIRTGVTFARLVYEHIEHPLDRSYTAWTRKRHDLNRWIELHRDWEGHRLVYIERCRLKPRQSAFEGYVIPPNIRCEVA